MKISRILDWTTGILRRDLAGNEVYEREEFHGRTGETEEEKENEAVVLLERATRERNGEAIGERKRIC